MPRSVELAVDDDLRAIARSIIELELSDVGWAERESDDEFRCGTYVGGYDADERAFCFAVFAGANELWFQLELDQVSDIATGAVDTYEARPAE
ncbi:hypothetical protein [Gaiella sp.]|uniref:hypothetical protein n=1 Tax=Gaiella sp. TaxID=2663207 RepID=UPI003983BEB9